MKQLLNWLRAKQAQTITLETVSPKDNNEDYLKTYNFYLKNGFVPLFDLKPQDCEWNAVYMVKNLGSNEMEYKDTISYKELT